MSRADRRREAKVRGKVRSDRPLVDLVIWTDGRDVRPTAESFDVLPMTVTEAKRERGAEMIIAIENAIARGRAPFIILTDADTVLQTPETLVAAVTHLERGAAVCGGLVVAPDGRVASAGYAVSVRQFPYFRFSGWSATHRKVQIPTANLQAVAFPFLATRRVEWQSEHFNKLYEHRAYADADYCVRLKRKGHMIVYEPGIVVQTSGALLPRPDDGAKMLFATAKPSYDEAGVL